MPRASADVCGPPVIPEALVRLYTYRVTPKTPQTCYLVQSLESRFHARFRAYLRDPDAQRVGYVLYNDIPAVLDFAGVREIVPWSTPDWQSN
jgi:hypothetical protein